jgi:hypothetical protein
LPRRRRWLRNFSNFNSFDSGDSIEDGGSHLNYASNRTAAPMPRKPPVTRATIPARGLDSIYFRILETLMRHKAHHCVALTPIWERPLRLTVVVAQPPLDLGSAALYVIQQK